LERIWDLEFWRKLSRRGTHVNTLKLGSRGAGKCFGGIQRFYAELRRELVWGNLVLGFLKVLLVVLRGATEEGDQWCAFERIWGYSLVYCQV
jgi:hypothetical protein